MDGAGSYSVAHRAGLLPTELTGMWGWILLRPPHRGRGSPPASAPAKQRPGCMRAQRQRKMRRRWLAAALPSLTPRHLCDVAIDNKTRQPEVVPILFAAKRG